MRIARSAVAFFAMVIATYAQTAAPAPGAASGIVTVRGGGQPLPGFAVTLMMQGGEMRRAVTGNDGRFAFENVRAGAHQLRGNLSGYTQLGPIPLVLASGQRVAEIQIKVKPTGAISGHVTDRNGDPAERAQVSALKYGYRDGIRTLTLVQTVMANDLGDYRLFWLPPGRYLVRARSAITAPADVGPLIPMSSVRALESGDREADVPVYYPGAADSERAVAVPVPSGGDVSGVDFTVAPARIFDVSGRVAAAVGGSISLYPVGAPATNSVDLGSESLNFIYGSGGLDRVGRDGSFRLSGVTAGRYTLVVSAGGPSAEVPIDVADRNLEGLSIGLTSDLGVEVKLVTKGRNSPEPPVITTADVSGADGFGESMANGVSLRRDPPIPGLPDVRPTMSFGRSLFSGLTAGNYRVHLTASSDRYPISMRLGGVDVMQGFRLDGSPPGPLEIVMGSNPATIDGKAVGARGEPIAGAKIVLVPDFARRSVLAFFKTAVATATGEFSLRGVAPGTYALLAFEDMESGDWQDPEFLKIYEARGTPVRVEEGGRERISLSVIPSP